MLIRGVVHDQIQEDSNAPFPRQTGQLAEVAKASQIRIHAVEVGNVVAVVATRAAMDGIEPEAGDADSGEIVQSADQSAQITATISIGILERSDVEAVDDRLLIPALRHPSPPRGWSSLSGAFLRLLWRLAADE